MTINNKHIGAAVLAAAIAIAGFANAGPTSTTTLLTAQFETRKVVTIEGGSFDLVNNSTIVGVMAEGVEISIDGKAAQRVATDESVSLTVADKVAKVMNASSEVPAKILTFVLN